MISNFLSPPFGSSALGSLLIWDISLNLNLKINYLGDCILISKLFGSAFSSQMSMDQISQIFFNKCPKANLGNWQSVNGPGAGSPLLEIDSRDVSLKISFGLGDSPYFAIFKLA